MAKIYFRAVAMPDELEMAKRLGIDTLELDYFEGPLCKGRSEHVLSILKEYGISVNVVTCTTGLVLETLKEDLDFVAKLGASYYVPQAPNLAYNDRDGINNFIKIWSEVSKYAQDKGVMLCVQSCGQSPQSWDIIFSRMDNTGLKYDPSFSLQAGRCYVSEILKYGNLIKHVHVKDEIILEQTTDYAKGIKPHMYVPAGMGDMHWGKVIAALYEVGYKGDYAIETHSIFWNSNKEMDIKLSKRHLEQFLL